VDVSIEPSHRPGVWADWWRISHSRDGFTIDFGARQPYATDQILIVARVHIPWRGPIDLIEEFMDAWERFAEDRERSE
jgi:hypothetical protein